LMMQEGGVEVDRGMPVVVVGLVVPVVAAVVVVVGLVVAAAATARRPVAATAGGAVVVDEALRRSGYTPAATRLQNMARLQLLQGVVVVGLLGGRVVTCVMKGCAAVRCALRLQWKQKQIHSGYCPGLT
jgi:TRAP-type mannitol/chloroaromatic compound transport system permease large subunit